MALALEWTGTFLSLTILGAAVLGGARLYRAIARSRSSAPVPGEPVERLGANLFRLRTKLEAAENEAFTPYKAARVRALRGAYVDVLAMACAQLEVPPPAARSSTAVPLTEIYRAEAALRACGLDVRRRVPT
jgi:hypothetical protein